MNTIDIGRDKTGVLTVSGITASKDLFVAFIIRNATTQRRTYGAWKA